MTSCSFNATLPGAGDFVVASAAVGGTTPEQSNVADGKVYSYYAQSFDFFGNVTGWEAGSGIYTVSTHTLKRTTITANSDGSSFPVNFPLAPIVGMYPSAANTLEPALGACGAWCGWIGTSGVINDGFNITSLVRTGVGLYTITFTKAFINAFYSVSFGSAGGLWFGSVTPSTRLNNGFGITYVNTTMTAADPGFGYVQVFGRQ